MTLLIISSNLLKIFLTHLYCLFDDGKGFAYDFESINQGRSRWISADKKTINTKRQELLETFGLGNDLYSIRGQK